MMRRGQASRAALVAMILFFISILSALPASAQTATPPPAPAQSAPAQPAQTQGAPVIDTADLKLWPEYDDPGVLVIFSGQFADSTKFPLQVAFPVPAGARNIQATYENETGSLINKDFSVKDGVLTYELPRKGFHLEYYVDRGPSGEQRDIAYDFVAPYAVNALTVDVQQPSRASGFTMTPASENSQTATDGLTYYSLNRRNLAAGEKLALDIKYTKTDTGLTAPQLAVTASAGQAAAGTAATATAATGSTNLLPYLLIGLGLALLAGVLLYWVLNQRRTSPAATAAASAPATSRTRSAAQGPASPAVRPAPRAQATGDSVSFCTNCGHPLKPEDRFCSQCGAQRRS